MDRLVKLFKDADEESSWVRVPVINYLRACPLPKAKEQIEELAKIDPDAVKRANTLFPFGGAAPKLTSGADALAAAKDGKADPPDKAKSQNSAASDAAIDVKPATDVDVPAIDKPAKAKPTEVKTPARKRTKNADNNRANGPGGVTPVSDSGGLDPGVTSQRWVVGGLALSAVVLLLTFLVILRGGCRAVV